MLLALVADHPPSGDLSATHWDDCALSLPKIRKSAVSGQAVKEAFSVKIQRKLASTVPPRPIVEQSLDDTLEYLGRMCRDGKDVLRALDYRGSSNTLVWIDLLIGFRWRA